uniref:Uncharacterized protein n=1 Tax=Pristhesancus plagipennis TaxID=1955184 RepID=A0A2K8JMF3_PRIPG|nr:secreted hypothetical protein [Pristhesancus plagipennis]
MKYFVCVLLFAGAALAQWGHNDDGQWRDDSHQWNNNQWNNNWNGGDDNGQYHADNSGQWDGDQGGQWNPSADGSLAGQYNAGAGQWNGPWAGQPAAGPWAGAPAHWNAGPPGVPQDTPEVAAAKAAHLAAHAAHGRKRRSAILTTAWAPNGYVATTTLEHGLVVPHAIW